MSPDGPFFFPRGQDGGRIWGFIDLRDLILSEWLTHRAQETIHSSDRLYAVHPLISSPVFLTDCTRCNERGASRLDKIVCSYTFITIRLYTHTHTHPLTVTDSGQRNVHAPPHNTGVSLQWTSPWLLINITRNSSAVTMCNQLPPRLFYQTQKREAPRPEGRLNP